MALGYASLSPLSGSDPNPILRVRPQMFSRHRKPRSAPVDPLLGKPASFGIHRYIQGSSNLFEENRLLKFAIVGLFGITAVLGAVIYSSDQKERTVVVPFGSGGDPYVTGSKQIGRASCRERVCRAV